MTLRISNRPRAFARETEQASPDLVAGPVSRGHGLGAPHQGTIIPRIIHQSWKTADIPSEFLSFVDSWRHFHPDWEYRLWTDDANRRLVAENYPWFLSQYDQYALPIQQVDAARYFLLHCFGGVYIDLDFMARRSLNALLDSRTCVLGMEPASNARLHGREKIIGNAIMAAVPAHPFFHEVIRLLPEFAVRPDVLASTGPFMVTDVYDAFDERETIHLAPSEELYPLTMEQADRFLATNQSEVDLSSAYAIHFHHGTWWRKPLTDAV